MSPTPSTPSTPSAPNTPNTPRPAGPPPPPRRTGGILAVIGPGVLVAATGVGAGDLATAGFAGAKLGLAVAWAVLLGAALKYILSENLARWQLGTGETVLEGAITRLGWPVHVGFALYMVPWSVFVGTALAKACGVTIAAILPDTFIRMPGGPVVAWGTACSLLGIGLVWIGGFRLFERVMAICVAVMVTVTVLAAILARPDPGALLRGLLVPVIPPATDPAITGAGEPLRWTIALLGGVGGTLTIIAYSYWMRETGRTRASELRTCRIDLAAGYGMTALFGVAMLVVAAGSEATGGGVGLVIRLADAVGASFSATFGAGAGDVGRMVFLVGAFAAVFSSLLGVWQVVPLIFADWWGQRHRVGAGERVEPLVVDPRSRPARGFLVWIGLASLPGLQVNFAAVQQWYGYVGALFIPGLAVALLILNGPRCGLPASMRNGPVQTALLALATLVLVALAGWDVARRAGWS